GRGGLRVNGNPAGLAERRGSAAPLIQRGSGAGDRPGNAGGWAGGPGQRKSPARGRGFKELFFHTIVILTRRGQRGKVIYSPAVMSDAGPMDWHLTLVVGLLTGFIAGFASGYGTRAFISFRRYYAAPRGWFRDPSL